MLISDEYRTLNVEVHQSNTGYGDRPPNQARLMAILDMMKGCRAVSLLDYGCGKGSIVSRLRGLGIDARGYDPCVDEFSQAPISADFVYCADFLEHIEPDRIDGVLDRIKGLVGKGVYIHIVAQDAALWGVRLSSKFEGAKFGVDATCIWMNWRVV